MSARGSGAAVRRGRSRDGSNNSVAHVADGRVSGTLQSRAGSSPIGESATGTSRAEEKFGKKKTEDDWFVQLVGGITDVVLRVVFPPPPKEKKNDSENWKSSSLAMLGEGGTLDQINNRISFLPSPLHIYLVVLLCYFILLAVFPFLFEYTVVRWTICLLLCACTVLYFFYRWIELREGLLGEDKIFRENRKRMEIGAAEKERTLRQTELDDKQQELLNLEMRLGILRKEVQGLLPPSETIEAAFARLQSKTEPATNTMQRNDDLRVQPMSFRQEPMNRNGVLGPTPSITANTQSEPRMTFATAPLILPEMDEDEPARVSSDIESTGDIFHEDYIPPRHNYTKGRFLPSVLFRLRAPSTDASSQTMSPIPTRSSKRGWGRD